MRDTDLMHSPSNTGIRIPFSFPVPRQAATRCSSSCARTGSGMGRERRVAVSKFTITVRARQRTSSSCCTSCSTTSDELPIFSRAVLTSTSLPKRISPRKSISVRTTTRPACRKSRSGANNRSSDSRPSSSHTGMTVLPIWPSASVSQKRGWIRVRNKPRRSLLTSRAQVTRSRAR